MLQLKHIRKSYKTDSFTQVALDDVSVTLRDNEFVAVLGPSGSGKTTLLNILGGLDRADSGSIVVSGVSTKDYRAKDWDTYRNHRVGFVFQSYNLIPHQSILSNVELTLTLSGVDRRERRLRARKALEQVGLAAHIHKRPAQLSGGQMQRVAIARALVNDPDIVLADEPTGALDTDTGVQVMDILKEVAKDRLVVMVTHNPELAQEYATRIIRVRDGRLDGDTHPPSLRERVVARREKPPASEGSRRASMGPLTALALSFNNLMTKKGRTALTAVAGSIGIIGIAAILALSNGVNNYIAKTEGDALSSYPVTINKSGFNVASLLDSTSTTADVTAADDGSIPQQRVAADMFAQVKSNDLRSFRQYLEDNGGSISPYVTAIQYGYGVTPQVYGSDTTNGVTRLNPSSVGQRMGAAAGSALTGGTTTSGFHELVGNQSLLDNQMNIVEGRWPQASDECVLILDEHGAISDYTLYSIGFYDPAALDQMVQRVINGEEVQAPDDARPFTYDDALNMTFTVIPPSDLYTKNESQGTWTDMSDNDDYLREKLANGIQLKVVGVVKAKDSTSASSSSGREGIGYTPALTQELIGRSAASQIVQEQLTNPDVDVFTGKTFEELQSEQGSSFDMSNIFSIDEDKLRQAFSFDANALTDAAGSVDLSGISMDSSGFDPSKINLDPSVVSSLFSSETMAQIMAGAPKFDLEDSGIPDVSKLTDDQRAAIMRDSSALASGFIAWMEQNHPDEVTSTDADLYERRYQEYIATDGGKAQLQALQDELEQDLGVSSMDDLVSTAMHNYLVNQFAPYFSQQMQKLMQQAAQAIALQIEEQLQQQVSQAVGKMGSQLSSIISSQLQKQMGALTSALQDGFKVDPTVFASAITLNVSQEDLTSLLTNYMNAGDLTYDGNLQKLGYADESDPKSIQIYPKDFDAKQSVLDMIGDYNAQVSAAGKEDQTIQYSDIAGTLMGAVTDIVDMISFVLIAFVSISLVVSSIMIGIITYISVLERRKEIGILRAMGASRLGVANIFNAETAIEGLFLGVLAIAIVLLISIPVNQFILQTRGIANIMALTLANALSLIAVSVILTLVAGVVPAMSAARRDPVEALRSE